MDFTQLRGFGDSFAMVHQMQKDGSCKDGENEIPFHHSLSLELEMAQNSLVKGQSSSGTGDYGAQGYTQCGSFISAAENMNWGEAENALSTRNSGVGGVCDVGIGKKLGDSTNDSNEDCRRNGGFNITESYERKRAQKGKVIIEYPGWSPHQMGLSGHTSTRQRSNQTEGRPSQNPLREGIGVNASNSGNQRRSINSLKEMLFNSGWVGVKLDNFRTKYYLSPSGSSYRSLPKAVEAFSEGTSERELDSSQLSGNQEHGRNSVDSPPDLCADLHSFGGHINVCKKKRGSRKRTRASSEFTASTEDLPPPRKQAVDKDISMEGISSRKLHGNKASYIVYEKGKSFTKYESSSCRIQKSDCSKIDAKRIDQGNESDMQHKLRRSARINGKHVPVDSDSDFDIETGGYEDYIDSSINFDVRPSLLPEKMQYTEEAHKAPASCIVGEKVTSCIGDKSLRKKNEKSSCDRMEAEKITNTDQTSRSNLRLINELLKVTKPKKVRDSLASSSCVSMESSLVPKEVGAGAASCTVNEKVKFCKKDESCSNEAEKLDRCREEDEAHKSSTSKMKVGSGLNSSEVETVKIKQNKKMKMLQYGKSLGLRRSPRFSKKSEFEGRVNRLAKKSKEKLFDLNVEPDTESESPMRDKILPAGEKFACQEVGDKQLIKEGEDKRRTETLVSEKHPGSSMSKRKAVRRVSSKGKNKVKSRGCRLMVRRPAKDECEAKLSSETKFTVLSWLIDAGMLTENEKVLYKGSNCKSCVLKGWLTRNGIKCNCCMEVVSLLEFEAHSGSYLRRPWENTYLSSGKTLMQCLSEAWEEEKNQKKVGFKMVGISDPDPSDDSCGVCGDGGSLICCDNCPSTFHQDCLKLKSLPEGKWYCPHCRCAFCKTAEQGVYTSPRFFWLFSCSPCGRKYHKECAWGHKLLMKGLVSPSFCGDNCQKVAAGLSAIIGISHPIGGGFSWSLLRRLNEDKGIISDEIKSHIMECNMKLTLALSVLDECFDPLKDPRTGVDIISQAVYNCGSNYSRLNFERFHTLILEKDNEIVSVATLRIHGTNLAEMPFIGTRPMYRRQGMCRRLLDIVEEMLSSLHVKKLIIPAISELLNTWTASFSFKPLEPSHVDEIRNLSLLVFAETTLLQKPIYNTVMKEGRGQNPYNQEIALTLSDVKPTFLQNNIRSTAKEAERGGHIIPSGRDAPSPSRLNPDYNLQGYPETTPCRLVSRDLPGQVPSTWNANMVSPNLQRRTLPEVIRPTGHIPIWF